MPRSLEERAISLALTYVPVATSLDPGPSSRPSNPKAALRRCNAAWQRVFDAYMETADPDDSSEKIWAANQAATAYCNAMPMLSGFEGIRDFIACAAHGILIGAIRNEKSGQLLYAAQVAQGSLRHEPKPAPTLRLAGRPIPLPIDGPGVQELYAQRNSNESAT
jgi:hypothetical protein